jgi:aminoglycoside phosphotransferase (APT) family kinase protein
MLATYSEPGGTGSLVGGSPATAEPGFPSGAELVARYAERTGRDLAGLDWFVSFALWKAAVFCEAIYGRYVRGELGAGDDEAAIFERAVPLMAAGAVRALDASSS